MNVSLILSAGQGVRFNNDLPKQYHHVLGREVISYSVDAMKKSGATDAIVIIAGANSVKRLKKAYGVACIAGGDTRNASVRNGLEYINKHFPGCCKVFFNDAVRPFLTAELVDYYYAQLDEYDAVITAQYITDSLGREDEPVIDRSQYYLIQTPEAFRFEPLYAHFRADSPVTAMVQQLPKERRVLRYYEYKHNMKITFPEDLSMAEQIMKLYR